MARVCLVGIDGPTAQQIRGAFEPKQHSISYSITHSQFRRTDVLDGIEAVLSGGEPHEYLQSLNFVRARRPDIPFVVISPAPSASAWLDALEAGAADFCALPVDFRHLQWMMTGFDLKRALSGRPAPTFR